jgi:pimeloyl-ACP methyl ester carboxylesterase
MADDLATVLDRLSTDAVRLVVAHDWGGPVAFLLMLRHPDKVSGLFGLNTLGPGTQSIWHFCVECGGSGINFRSRFPSSGRASSAIAGVDSR